MGSTSRKGRAFPHSRGRSPLKRHDRSLIWTAAGLPRHVVVAAVSDRRLAAALNERRTAVGDRRYKLPLQIGATNEQ